MKNLIEELLLKLKVSQFPSSHLQVDSNLIKELLSLGYNISEIRNRINKSLSNMISDTFELEEETDSVEEEKLISQFLYLDKILYCSIGKTLRIGINESMVGNEYSYELKDYEIDAINRSISLQIERKDDKYRLWLGNINDIKWNGKKVWVYMDKKNWRFYHNIEEENLERLPHDFRSQNIELEEDLQIYKQYENTNMPMYYAERFKYNLRNSNLKFSQFTTVDVDGNPLIFVTGFFEGSVLEPTGDIYAFSENGDEGRFHYKFNRNSVYIQDMLPERISKGVGSRALEFIETIAVEYDKDKITGKLSGVDFGHKDRLLHFYKKNGYTVNLDNFTIVKPLNIEK